MHSDAGVARAALGELPNTDTMGACPPPREFTDARSTTLGIDECRPITDERRSDAVE